MFKDGVFVGKPGGGNLTDPGPKCGGMPRGNCCWGGLIPWNESKVGWVRSRGALSFKTGLSLRTPRRLDLESTDLLVNPIGAEVSGSSSEISEYAGLMVRGFVKGCLCCCCCF